MSTTKQTYKVEGLHCSGCANLLRSVLEEDVAGVEKADVSLERHEVEITFDEQTYNHEAAAKHTLENGYTLVKP
jgi:copper chaperone CopZ